MRDQQLYVVKIGGNVLDDPALLAQTAAAIAACEARVLVVHGGGKKLDQTAAALGLVQQKVQGRRITDQATLDLALMVYAGLINKKLVALLNKAGACAIGLTGADADTVRAVKRPVGEVDFGLVGDVAPNGINAGFLKNLLEQGLVPVFCSITHNNEGHLFNTNADTMAAELAAALSVEHHVTLLYCFEQPGVMRNIADPHSLIPFMDAAQYNRLRADGVVKDGMIPKLDNAFSAIERGVAQVDIMHAASLADVLSTGRASGTRLLKTVNQGQE